MQSTTYLVNQKRGVTLLLVRKSCCYVKKQISCCFLKTLFRSMVEMMKQTSIFAEKKVEQLIGKKSV